MRPALVSVGTSSGYMGVLRHTDLTDVRPPAGTPIPARWPRLPGRDAVPPTPIHSAFLFSLTVAESDSQRRNKMTLQTKSDRLAKRQTYIPEGAIKDQRSTNHFEIYRYEIAARFYAIVFSGTSAYPTWHLCFLNSVNRDESINRFIKNQETHLKSIADRKELWMNFKHDINVGDIFYTHWGYDQTNVEFMQVVRVVTPKTVEIREIKKTVSEYANGGMSGRATPCKDEFIGEAKRCRAKPSHDRKTYLVLPLHSCSDGYRWEGEPMFCSWYA